MVTAIHKLDMFYLLKTSIIHQEQWSQFLLKDRKFQYFQVKNNLWQIGTWNFIVLHDGSTMFEHSRRLCIYSTVKQKTEHKRFLLGFLSTILNLIIRYDFTWKSNMEWNWKIQILVFSVTNMNSPVGHYCHLLLLY